MTGYFILSFALAFFAAWVSALGILSLFTIRR
jgi:hypothetical protein